MFSAAELAEDRAEFRALLTDTCRIVRMEPGANKGTFNEDTGQYEGGDPPVTVYEGPCRLQVKVDINSNVVEATAGEREWTYLTAQLQLPADSDPRVVSGSSGDVRVDDYAIYLTAPHDSSLVGRHFNIAGPYHKSQATYRRFRVKEAVA